MNKRWLLIILIAISLVAIVVTSILSSIQKSSLDNQVVCTMDAKICPDGSAVGRSGPNCEFNPCP